MGLDNLFLLRKRSDQNFKVELSYFRGFYTLKNRLVGSLNDSEIEISIDELNKLYYEIKDIYNELKKYSDNEIRYFDDCGYPDELCEKFYGCEFDPTLCCGLLIIHLFYSIKSIIEIIDLDYKNDYYISFESSY